MSFALQATRSGAQKANALHGGGKRLAVRAVQGRGVCAFIGAKRRAFTGRSGLLGAGLARKGRRSSFLTKAQGQLRGGVQRSTGG